MRKRRVHRVSNKQFKPVGDVHGPPVRRVDISGGNKNGTANRVTASSSDKKRERDNRIEVREIQAHQRSAQIVQSYDGSSRPWHASAERTNFNATDLGVLIDLKSQFNYDKDHLKIKKKTLNKSTKFLIVIPVMKRETNLYYCLKNLTAMISKSEHANKIQIVVVENDENLINESTVKEHDCLYIGVQNGCRFNKSLCMNYAFLTYEKSLNKDSYLLFHDVDLIMSHNFIDSLVSNVQPHPKTNLTPAYFQCFGKRAVKMMTANDTEKIRLELSKSRDISTNGLGSLPPSQAPGGSVCFRKDIFSSIGGFDPEWFDLYNSEDAAIWIKANRLIDRGPFAMRAVSPHRGRTPDLSDVYALHQFHELPPHDSSDMESKFWIPGFLKYCNNDLMTELLSESQKCLKF